MYDLKLIGDKHFDCGAGEGCGCAAVSIGRQVCLSPGGRPRRVWGEFGDWVWRLWTSQCGPSVGKAGKARVILIIMMRLGEKLNDQPLFIYPTWNRPPRPAAFLTCRQQTVMSETDDDYHESGYPVVASLGGDDKDVPQNKKRKIQRACDVCRRKKVSNHWIDSITLPIPVHPSSLGARNRVRPPRLGWVATLPRPPWETRSPI
jgi:hypothetical protein